MAAKKKPFKARHSARKPVIYREPELLKLDLGSGDHPAEGFLGVDIVEGLTDHAFDLCSGKPWPFASSSIDELRSSHYVEHIDACYLTVNGKRIDALLWFFDEAFRVAKPGALFTCQWPALQNARAFQDPTHRRFIPHTVINYLSVEGRTAMGVQKAYGATCNWIGTVQPTIAVEPESEEDKAMALRADSSDDKQKWMQKKALEQQRRFDQTWNFAQDFIAQLKAIK